MAEVSALLKLAESPTSLDAPVDGPAGEAGAATVLDGVVDDGASDPEHVALHHEVDLLLSHGLDTLNEREREVLAGRFGLGDREPETLEALAGRLDLTRERVRQIQNEATHKLRQRLMRQGLDRHSVF
jgi:RNA polymerase nonessential primary-like sigma factor